MARTALIKRGTLLPSSRASRWLTEAHDSTSREDHADQQRSHLATAELIERAGRNRRGGVTSHQTRRGIFHARNGTIATKRAESFGLKKQSLSSKHLNAEQSQSLGLSDARIRREKLHVCMCCTGSCHQMIPRCLLGRLSLCWEWEVIRLVGCQCQEIERQS